MPVPVRHVNDIDADFWTGGIEMFSRYVSPWLSLVDDARYQATVARIEALHPTAILGCHTPVIDGDYVAGAIATGTAPTADVPAEPDQAVLVHLRTGGKPDRGWW